MKQNINTQVIQQSGLRTYSPVYGIWHGMLQRCERPDNISYPNYGGRGITVCSEWHDFFTFERWALSHGFDKNNKNLQLGRKDYNQGYSPDNCQFITREEADRHKRSNVMITVEGQTKCATDWEKCLGLKEDNVGKWVRDNGMEYAETRITALLHGKPWYDNRAVLLTVNKKTESCSEWARILDWDGSTLSRWVKTYGKAYAEQKIEEALAGTFKLNHATKITVRNETHNISEWDKIIHTSHGVINKWIKKHGLDYAVSKIEERLPAKEGA